jgi:hypothetical protein
MEQLRTIQDDIVNRRNAIQVCVTDINYALEEIQGSVVSAVEEIQRLERIYQARTNSSRITKDKELKQPELGFKNEQLDDFFN